MAWWVTELGEGLNTPLTDLSVKKVYYRRVPSKVLSGFSDTHTQTFESRTLDIHSDTFCFPGNRISKIGFLTSDFRHPTSITR
jgi:hypothetical protein